MLCSLSVFVSLMTFGFFFSLDDGVTGMELHSNETLPQRNIYSHVYIVIASSSVALVFVFVPSTYCSVSPYPFTGSQSSRPSSDTKEELVDAVVKDVEREEGGESDPVSKLPSIQI